MRLSYVRPCILLLALACACAPATPDGAVRPPAAADSAAVAQTLERFVRAFNDLDWTTFRDHFADDATVFFPMPSSRMRGDGRAEVEAVFGALFRSARSSGNGPPYLNIRPRDVRIQMLGNAAVATFHLGADDERSVGRRTLVLRRDGDGPWRIVHLHASVLDREAPKQSRGPT